MSRPQSVLLMARQLDQGGSERQLAEMAKALDRSLFSPHVGAFRPDGLRWRELESAGIPLIHFPVPSITSVKGAFAIAGYVRRHGIRLVHTFDTPANVYGVPSARMAGAPVVLSSQRAHRDLAPRFRYLLRLTDLLADGIVVNCEFIRRHLMEDEGVPARRIHLCHNGVDVDVFHALGRCRPEALSDASLVVGVVCALRPEKGLTALLEAFALVRARQAGMKLAIVGSGACAEELHARAAALGILQDCVFQPAVSNVAPWLRGIDIFVLPSLTEALSNSLMEAMSCGCCVVASRVGGNPELVADSETGLLFDRGDVSGLALALNRLIDQPSWRAELGCNASRLMRRSFRLDLAARRVEEVYAALLSRVPA
jgi:glycosyltransferase involved in cell wall biosynthesis